MDQSTPKKVLAETTGRGGFVIHDNADELGIIRRVRITTPEGPQDCEKRLGWGSGDLSGSLDGGEEPSENWDSLDEFIRRKLFMSPDLSKTPDMAVSKEGRAPFGLVPDNIILRPWKGLSEHRRKLSLESPDRLPPFFDATKSVPAKLNKGRHLRNSSDPF